MGELVPGQIIPSEYCWLAEVLLLVEDQRTRSRQQPQPRWPPRSAMEEAVQARPTGYLQASSYGPTAAIRGASHIGPLGYYWAPPWQEVW